MALTQEDKILRKMKELRDGRPDFLALRYLYPMTDLQAALGLSQIARYHDFLRVRKEIADYYFTKLSSLPVQLPLDIKNRSIFFRFPLRTNTNFESIKTAFAERGIQVRKGVDSLLHRMRGMDPKNFPVTERLFSETVCIPIYPALDNKHWERIAVSCQNVFTKKIKRNN